MQLMTKRILIIVAVVLVLGALAYPKVKPLFSDSGTQQQSGSSQPSAVFVDGYVINPQYIEDKIFTTGTILANEEVELLSESSGKITDIYFEEGQTVSKGQILLKINDSELQAQRQRTQYRLSLAEKREERQSRLLEKGGISQEDYEATLNEVNVLKSELALIDAQIDKSEIRAPFEGIIGLKYVSEGDYISPTTRIAGLQDIQPVKIDFSIPERYAYQIEKGKKVTFTVQGVNQTFEGEIYAVEPKIDTQTRTVSLRAISDNEENILLPGAFADIQLILQTYDDAKMIPSIALIPELNGQKVFVSRSGKAVSVPVTTGIRTEKAVQVLDGLSMGDTVLTTGLLQVREGTAVQFNSIDSTLDVADEISTASK
ncbi:MAG: efflux RND transporter periplasmic adaptor subunit [Bacteroidota bacterium]